MTIRITTLSAITSELRIVRGHPVRVAFSGRSTGSDQGCYYSTKGHAINTFDGELQAFDLCLDRDDLMDFSGDEGRKVIEVHDEFGHCAGHAVISWFRMESGNYEFVGYIA
jgi:hypothetical protein